MTIFEKYPAVCLARAVEVLWGRSNRSQALSPGDRLIIANAVRELEIILQEDDRARAELAARKVA